MREFMRSIMVIYLLFVLLIHSANCTESYCILDSSGNTIKAMKELEKLAPASTIKLLTAMVVIDKIPLNQKITATRSVYKLEKNAVHIAIKHGEVFTCQDLLKAMLISSANDAAIALAEGVAGSISEFSLMMNEKAQAIGCKNSNFVNPNGMTAKEQYSCAYDLALIALVSAKYPKIQEILACHSTTILRENGSVIPLKNGNKMLSMANVPVFGKTGYTSISQNTFAGFCNINGKGLVIGLMGVDNRPSMWQEIMKLLELHPKVQIKNADELSKNNKNIQTMLYILGYYKGKIDGALGPQSQTAIREFQKDFNLKIDGKVGRETWTKLVEVTKKKSQTNTTTSPPSVPPKPIEN